jgi:hypothetical protein
MGGSSSGEASTGASTVEATRTGKSSIGEPYTEEIYYGGNQVRRESSTEGIKYGGNQVLKKRFFKEMQIPQIRRGKGLFF